jgi:hypothetical protein
MPQLKPIAAVLILTIGMISLFIACGDDDDDGISHCTPGTLNCICTEMNECGEGLVCDSTGRCITAGTGGDGTDTDVLPELGGYAPDQYANPAAMCDPQPTNMNLIADAEGWVGQCQNRFGLQGVWFSYTDQDNQGGGESTIALDLTNAGTGKVCASGVAGQVKHGFFSTYWGAGIAVNLCESGGDNSVVSVLGGCALFDSRTTIIGFRITFETEQMPDSQLRIQFSENGRQESTYIPIVASGTADYLFEDAAVFYSTDTDVPPIHPTEIEALQFQVSTIETADVPFNFCVSDITPILGYQ